MPHERCKTIQQAGGGLGGCARPRLVVSMVPSMSSVLLLKEWLRGRKV